MLGLLESGGREKLELSALQLIIICRFDCYIAILVFSPLIFDENTSNTVLNVFWCNDIRYFFLFLHLNNILLSNLKLKTYFYNENS